MATVRRGLVDKVKKVAAKAGTRGARVLVETTAAAVKTVDKLQAKLGRGARKPSTTRQPAKAERTPEASPPPPPRGAVAREAGRKTMPAAAPKRSKPGAGKQFKVKRGQKHPHSGR